MFQNASVRCSNGVKAFDSHFCHIVSVLILERTPKILAILTNLSDKRFLQSRAPISADVLPSVCPRLKKVP